MVIDTNIERSLLELVENAGERLVLNIYLPGGYYRDAQGYTIDPEKTLSSAEIEGGKVVLNLVFPKNEDFSDWAEAIVKTEELMDVVIDKEVEESAIQSAYNELIKKIEEAKNGSSNRRHIERHAHRP